MVEQASGSETIGCGELLHLWHPGTRDVFSGYGLTVAFNRPDTLVGLLLVDRPAPANPAWLQTVADTYGECRLAAMTAGGERGLVCRMHIDLDSLGYVRRMDSPQTLEILEALYPLMERPPAPALHLRWDEVRRLWRSEFAFGNVLPPEIRQLFADTGPGCLAVESDIGVIHVCHAADRDIAGFAGKPVQTRWQLVQMPTAPLIRLALSIYDDPIRPFLFESFLNVAAADQARILSQLTEQRQLHLAFYGENLTYRYTKVLPHDARQGAQLAGIVAQARTYWDALPPVQRDFDLAKAAFMQLYP